MMLYTISRATGYEFGSLHGLLGQPLFLAIGIVLWQ